jgi:hypothetical protein
MTKDYRRSGIVLVELLQGATLSILATLAIFLIATHLWVRSYVQSESFFIYRAQLYNNSQSCSATQHLVPQSFVARDYQCFGSKVIANYRLLPGSVKDPKISENLNGQLTLGF